TAALVVDVQQPAWTRQQQLGRVAFEHRGSPHVDLRAMLGASLGRAADRTDHQTSQQQEQASHSVSPPDAHHTTSASECTRGTVKGACPTRPFSVNHAGLVMVVRACGPRKCAMAAAFRRWALAL